MDLENSIVELVSEETDKPALATSKFEDLTDSLEFLDLIEKVEDTFSVKIDDTEFEQLVTVADLVAMVKAKKN